MDVHSVIQDQINQKNKEVKTLTEEIQKNEREVINFSGQIKDLEGKIASISENLQEKIDKKNQMQKSLENFNNSYQELLNTSKCLLEQMQKND